MPNGIGSRIKTGSCQTGQLPGRIKSELCDSSGLRIDLISRLLSLSRLYSGILHSLSLSLSPHIQAPRLRPALLAELCTNCRVPYDMASSEGTGALYTMDLFLR